MAAPGSVRLWRPGECACSAGSIARQTFDAGPMLTLVESSVGELCPDRAPESGIVHHPFWGLPNPTACLRVLIEHQCGNKLPRGARVAHDSPLIPRWE